MTVSERRGWLPLFLRYLVLSAIAVVFIFPLGFMVMASL